LLSVDANEENLDKAVDILNRYSPLDVQREGARSESGVASDTRTNTGSERVNAAVANQANAVPVIVEELRVGKRAVLRGGVRVYSRVLEQPVEQSINLQDERVRVERQSVNRPATESDFITGRDEVIEVVEYSEEPVVSKDARVVEEVRINKEAGQRTETVRDKVRRTEVNVENLGEQGAKGASARSDLDQDFRTDFTKNYSASGDTYEDYAPAYCYGYDMAGDPRYQGKDFNQVEPQLRTEYNRTYPNSTWEKIENAVRYGWNKVTGRSSSAGSSR
jgi:uncharacterized protein (TIGR02271 family)